MSQVSPSSFDNSLPIPDVYNLVNTLPVSYLTFAQQTHYWGRMYGVITGENNEQDWDEFVVNQCLRDALWSTLRTITDETELRLGYNFSSRFHAQTIAWPGDKRIRTWPGIESVDILQKWTTLLGYDQVAISPFIATNVTVAAGPPPVVSIPMDVCDNPNNLIFRRNSDNGTYEADPTRRPVRAGANWQVTLDNSKVPYLLGDVVNVQDAQFVFVDIVPPVCTGTVYPVYPGTTQIIPQAKPMQVLQNGKHRYWFYIYTLVDPAFYNNPINLVKADFYKLLPAIAFKCYEEVTAKAALVKRCNCDGCTTCKDQLFQVTTRIIDSQNGVVDFCVDGELVDDDDDGIYTLKPASQISINNPDAEYTLTFYYKTNPIFLSEVYRKAIPTALRAIIYRSAAELPVIDCGCWMEKKMEMGFIYRQQESFADTTTNQFTGTTKVSFDYGDMRGQKAYSEWTSHLPLFKFILI